MLEQAHVALNFGALVWNTHVAYQGTSCWNIIIIIIMCRSVCCPAAECACVCVRARGVAMATTLRRCVCTGTCHARAGKPVRFHNSSICWQGVVADVGNIILAVGMMQQFSYGLHVWR